MPYYGGPGDPVLRIGTSKCTESESNRDLSLISLACSSAMFDEAAEDSQIQSISSDASVKHLRLVC